MGLLETKVINSGATSLTGQKPVRFFVRFTIGAVRHHKKMRWYGRPQKFTLGEVCVKLADAWSLTERELAYIVSMRPGDAPFVNEDLHIERRP